MHQVIKWGERLASLKLFFFTLLWLMILLTIGTIAQRDIGLYQAQQVYFSSWIVWSWGFLPLPGGMPTMGCVFVGLLAKLIFKTPLTFRNMGIAITHLGAFLLLLGGVITGFLSFEGQMSIVEGQKASHFIDYHKIELAIIDSSPKDTEITYKIPGSRLEIEGKIESEHFPFEIDVINYCKNCNYVKREIKDDDKTNYVGFSKNFKLQTAKLSKQDEQNRPGVTFKITNSDNDGVYSIFDNMKVDQTLKAGGKTYTLKLRRKHYDTPFTIELLDFIKIDYAATAMAKAYKSIVNIVSDDGAKQRTVIQMNEPLRLKGYTLYQSSYFVAQDGKETSVFAIVHNYGRIFPYVSSIIMCIGIILHLLITSGVLKKPVTKVEGE